MPVSRGSTVARVSAESRDPAALVAAAGAGDATAWNALVERFAGLVWSVIRSHGVYGDGAGDVFQTTWLRLVEHLDRLREPHHVGAWLATTARHESLRVLRKSGRQVLVGELPEYLDEDSAEPVDTALLAGERRASALEAMAAAPPRCQQLLRLMMVEPALSYDEIAEILGWPKGSIGPTRGRCLERIRAGLGRSGIQTGGIQEDPDGS